MGFLRALVGADEFARWEQLSADRKMTDPVSGLMEAHYDLAYTRSTPKHYPAVDRSPMLEPKPSMQGVCGMSRDSSTLMA